MECTCEVDVDCPYCTAQNESEKHLYSISTKAESERMEKEEFEAYKNMKKSERKEKQKALMEIAKQPLPPLPIKEPSEYEKIREEFIAQRKREWTIYEKEWERKWQERKNGS